MNFLLSFVSLVIMVSSVTARLGKSAACGTCTEWCSLIPPATGSDGFCYLGTKADAAKCWATDPLITDSYTWSCTNCTVEGYPVYKRNDPVYKNMQLWSKASKKGKDAVV